MKKITIFFILILFFASCKKSVKDVELIYDKTIQIPQSIDIDLGHRGNIECYKWNNTEYLTGYSNNDKSLHIFNLQTLKEENKIDLSNLPGKENVRDFKFLNQDTILLTTQHSNTYYIVDKNSNVLKTFTLKCKQENNLPDDVNYGNFNGGSQNIDILFIDNKYILVYQSVFYYIPKYNKFKDIYILNYEVADSINISVKNVINHYDLYDTSKVWTGNNNPNLCYVNNKILVSYFNNPDFKTIDIETGEINTIQCQKSNLIDSIIPFDTLYLTNAKYITLYSLDAKGYYYTLYDPIRKLIFRIAALPIEEEFTYLTPFINTTSLKPFSIMVYDTDYNLITEYLFPAKYYDYSAIIFTRQGMMIDIANRHNPNFKNSILEYDVYKIKKIME